MFFGADTYILRQLAGEADELAAMLTETASVLNRALGLLPSIWVGPDADAFAQLITDDHMPRLNAATERLGQAASSMRGSARSQDAVSSA